MKTQPVMIPCGPIKLEGIWHLHDEESPRPCVVVCHPHPLYGGNMHNGMVAAVCRELAAHSINALRFNFRGMGESQGHFDNGIGEKEDVKAALSLAASSALVEGGEIGLCGYSFGAGIALSVAPLETDVQALAVVSPPLFPANWTGMKNYTRPRLFIAGTEDTMFPADELKEMVSALPPPAEYYAVEGADHFWFGYEDKAVKKIAEFFSGVFHENH
ncbi:alpha/beta hydrolase [Chloroflexota bacterium]